MWWNIQCILLAWLIIRQLMYTAQKPPLRGFDIFHLQGILSLIIDGIIGYPINLLMLNIIL